MLAIAMWAEPAFVECVVVPRTNGKQMLFSIALHLASTELPIQDLAFDVFPAWMRSGQLHV